MAIIAIICLLVGGAAGYFGRGFFQRPGSGRFGTQGQFRTGAAGQNGQRPAGGSRVFGTVQSLGDGRITVQTPNGGSQIVLTNNNTAYQHVTSGSASDVTAGTQVLVSGQQNPDGSTTAMSIEVIPPGMNFPFGNRQ